MQYSGILTIWLHLISDQVLSHFTMPLNNPNFFVLLSNPLLGYESASISFALLVSLLLLFLRNLIWFSIEINFSVFLICEFVMLASILIWNVQLRFVYMCSLSSICYFVSLFDIHDFVSFEIDALNSFINTLILNYCVNSPFIQFCILLIKLPCPWNYSLLIIYWLIIRNCVFNLWWISQLNRLLFRVALILISIIWSLVWVVDFYWLWLCFINFP